MDARGLCPSHLTEDALPTTKGRPPDDEILRWWNENKEQRFRYQPLLVIAARLGDDRLILGDSHVYHISGSGFYQSRAELFPWIEQFREASMVTYVDRPDSLQHAAQGLVGMRKAGFEADIDEIAESLCVVPPDQREKVEDCASAIRKAELLLDKDSTEELRVLDEIEEAAIRLGVYQY